MLDRLAAAIDRHFGGVGSATAVPRLTLVAVDQPIEPTDQLYDPMICFVADGTKRTTAGELRHVAHAGEMLFTTIDLPVTVELEKVPYRSAVVRLDSQALTELLVELHETGPATPPAVAGQVTAPMTPELVDAVTRYVQLLDTPDDIRPLAARIESEILYRLLRSSLAPILREWSLADSTTTRMREVTRWICARYTEPLSIDEIAAVARMSPASLHRHFKATTGMSPLKYQKHLRLQEARRLLVAGDASAAQIAQAVGYASATQFNREYRSTYGLPPGQDAARLRARLTHTPTAPTQRA
ncbi:AraC-like DNA-binding protein [Streptomyces griseochromogenes]|uniref:AraC family transcriptional regulator n=1 Tax=Streptomyces griseochromogenes TaxID=68214 RepID=A0A1B1B0M2_9ACTN|nr:AraC family transcriptional regulator [Streptomyces griseochromogenes]ANP52383.1 AraC family transcriptional regulator [Streptomyces griseochromogenes]MBP2055282.1 AraC-like DNA-binding protein [Streptomyces griseochromogenes]